MVYNNELFKKIVTDRRGGYCFELNGLFCALLNAFCARSVHEPFLKKQIMWRLTREGVKYSLSGGSMKITV